ncbi:two-component system, NtrC family, sensor histidine kinase PilS [Methylomarinovum caldicuralii]|uniref:histidine kinase n=1 Tax=Methylomarinovum caldicuralii TaxID=438856 RepID=A0AAU9C4K3_9GAMM|nr:ATP-binding protein [Methylomarinovum caldicuralii]BCX82693.1 two-component system, NtrC family, sensor histidine kinase PilS [Methylomarinovum caldicuralii]
MTDSAAYLQPCPYSAYRIETAPARRLLRVFALYQLTAASLLCILFFTHRGPTQLGAHAPDLFGALAAVYAAATWFSLPLLWLNRPGYRWQAAGRLGLDLVVLPGIIYACGGLGSGFGILLAVSVAASGLLIGGRCALGYAALAALAVLGVEGYADWRGGFEASHYTYAAMLGIAYFAIAGLAVALAQRAEESTALAERRQVDLANLQRLNASIVQHLQAGILVLDDQRRLRLTNQAALALLGLAQPPGDASGLPGLLSASLREWQARGDPEHQAVLTTDHGPLHLSASRLSLEGETLTLVLLEDDRLHQKRVQESKLTSLGRLTAGIAHEIRNPLGAIGHAAQLLEESPHLDPQDLRLVAIIRKHVRRVDETIDNVLQLSRRSAAKRQRLELRAWLQRFRTDFEEETRSQSVDLELPDEEISALIDPGQLKQILSNLCSNALKYGGGAVRIRLIQEDRHPCIEVIDQGPGIATEHLSQIFEPFFTTSGSGTGLGLYIARELAQLNQARLEYDNGPRGSRFRILLTPINEVILAP